MKAKSFLDILEEQIRTEVRRELQQEFADQPSPPLKSERRFRDNTAADAHVLQMDIWLSSHLDQDRLVGSARGKSVYRRHRRPQPETTHHAQPELRIRLSPQHSLALEVICRFAGASTPTSLTVSELKSIWRRAALKTHPDRVAQGDLVTQARAAALFRELCDAHNLLKELFDEDRVAGAA